MASVCVVNAQKCVESQKHSIAKYSPKEIINSDHCSFQQEYVSPRTLHLTGERATEVAVRRKNNRTHSYTVQPITLADGRLLDKFLLILREKEIELDPIVQKDMIIPANVIVQASKSGECSIEKHRVFLNDVLRPLVLTKFLLLTDS